MPNFTVRVELHSVSDLNHQTYAKLHAAMENGGFSRTIAGRSGKRYHLPRAEYDLAGPTITAQDVRLKASDIADSIDRDNGILITEGVQDWRGLKEVKKDEKK